MIIEKPKLFENGRLNYRTTYKQFQHFIDDDKWILMETQRVYYIRFPFVRGVQITTQPCLDTGAYYRQ